MQRLQFIIVYPIIWLFSRLPFFILHRISDVGYFFLFYIFGYRKEVVLENLKLAFPKKNSKQLFAIRRHFFKHFIDVFVEMIKSFSISKKQLNKRYKYTNPEIFREFEESKTSLIIMGSHYANWEWIINLSSFTSLNCVGVYSKIKNPFFNKLIKKNRSRFNCEFIQTDQTLKKLIANKQNKIPSLYGLLSDQSPAIQKTHYWSEFLNVKVPIHTGAEMLAKKHGFAVLYMHVERIKRSHYQVTFETLTKTPSELPDFSITDSFLERAEKCIIEKPQYYFWTHRRFKHREHAPK